MGIKENNLSLPDIESVELKAHRDGSSNMITLFTFNRGAWVMDPLEAVKKYGTRDNKGRLGLYFTMNFEPNSAGLYLLANAEFASVRHIDGSTLAKWRFDDLQEQFKKKVPALIFVRARAEYKGEDEYFHFYRAELLQGTSASVIRDNIRSGHILIDLRLHDKGTRIRNHGTGFRIYEKYLSELFVRRTVIE